MNRPKQYLMNECDSEVIDYVSKLEREARYHQQELDSLLARLRETEAERDALQAKLDELIFEWNTIEGLK